MKKENVVIIGAGTGGTVVANILARKIGKKANITVLTAKDSVYYEPDNLFRLFDNKDMKSQFKSVRKVINKKVDVKQEVVTKVDPNTNLIFTESGTTYPYDYLVIAAGAQYDFDALPGYKEGAYNFHNGPDVLKLREALQNFEGGNLVMGIADIPFKCPVSPLEFVFMAYDFYKRKKMLDKVKIHLTSPLPRAFSIENVSEKAQKKFDKYGIEVHTFFNTELIDPEKKVVESLEGEEIPYDLLVMVPPHKGPDFLEVSKLANDESWLPVNRETLVHDRYDNIWGLGDCTNLPVSKAGAAAHHQGKIVAANIANLVKKKEAKKKYNGEVQCFLMTGLTTSIFLDFNYNHPPRNIFLKDFFFMKKGWYIAKKLFKPMYFKLVLAGRI
jgi:sulfide:quinone oxidoreductase